MRIDLPTCELRYCRYYADGNCIKKEKYKVCDYAITTSMLDAFMQKYKWEIHNAPKTPGEYTVLVFDIRTQYTSEAVSTFTGSEFITEDGKKVVAWMIK